MKKFLFLMVFSFFVVQFTFSQNIFNTNSKLLLKNDNSVLKYKKTGLENINFASPHSKESFDLNTATFLFALLINPMLVYENEKVNFGLTKEVSLALPYFVDNGFGSIGRLGLEYSYIFRSERNHHFRSFFDLGFPLESSEYVAVTVNVGGGYFTDFKKNGIFPQVSFNMIIPVNDNLAVNPYVKLRHTFMLDKTQPDVTDISIGIGFMAFTLF
jgi:hypothetical protein